MKLSLCIATMNRWKFLSVNLPKYLENPYIGEIIISDENGNDAKLIKENFTDSRIKVYVNETRLGAFRNKRKAVSYATLPWICLMDSDNFASIEYFHAWRRVFDPENTSMIYSPSMTYPTENHSGFNWRHMTDDIITPSNLKEMYVKFKNNHQFAVGNYIFSKEQFMKAEHTGDSGLDTRCTALDVQYQNYLLFKAGASMKIVFGMVYYHIVHDGSYYINEGAMAAEKEIFALYENYSV